MDLNEGLTRRKFTHGNAMVLFDPKKIIRELCIHIRNTPYVVGCIAWFTNAKVLKVLERTRGCAFVVTKHKMAHIFKSTYDELPKFDRYMPVRVVGNGRGVTKNLMHHKFVVGLDTRKRPVWVATGSFNITKNAETNLENMMILNDTRIAHQFYEEFKRIRRISKTIGNSQQSRSRRSRPSGTGT